MSRKISSRNLIKKQTLCSVCLRNNGKYNRQLTLHHIKPLSEGGTDNKNNIQIICLECHRKIHGFETSDRLKKQFDFWTTI